MYAPRSDGRGAFFVSLGALPAFLQSLALFRGHDKGTRSRKIIRMD